MEIRLHGRGGQGGVTCAKILAACYARGGKHVQTFGDYAGERSGAPVRAYTRVDDAKIENRNKVYRPDHVMVLDQHLLGADTLDGLAPGGILLVNTGEPLESFDARFDGFRLATVDATGIARRHGIGTRTVVIVNTTIAGAFARLAGIPLDVLEATYRSLGFLSNLAAAREAYECVRWRAPLEPGPQTTNAPAALYKPAPVEPLTEHLRSAPTGIQTGTWSSQRPRYVEVLAPCNAWCPAGNDVVGFVQALAQSGLEEAGAVLRRTTPLAGTCGRVCPAPCMEGCNRVEYDGAVNIRGLERWIADQAPVRLQAAQSGRRLKIAIVGGGPAGIAAAWTLALAGHHATIHERERELGGLLATGIPSYRLPREVLRRELALLQELGVETHTGRALQQEELRALAKENDALILATGLQRLRGLDVPGTKLPGVEEGLHFLRRVNLEGGTQLSGHVVVLGGGNSAMDCARSALRLGASRVTVAYRRTQADMPAIREEIVEALHEGVELRVLCAPVAFVGDTRLRAVELAEVELGEPDATGRRTPIVSERVTRLSCEHVLLALGQAPDVAILPAGWGLLEGRVFERGQPLNVFAAGDLATGDGTVAHAIGSGRRAATTALRALGLEVEIFQRPERAAAVPSTDIRFDHFERRASARESHAQGRAAELGFAEVNHGLADALEAHRCFSCGHCTQCDTCLVYCPEGVVRRAESGYSLDYTYCKGCGICVHECPRKGMEMTTT
jgi:2-oxoacid:acceptor oxidoreductase gamma subunit (pyruvate/2-ketoisovalerate family)/2-oxoacid:acceptor oxidoreductase delta subunit (pyruvate/2-ketoisovalerate family)